jgi:hypothetical protein
VRISSAASAKTRSGISREGEVVEDACDEAGVEVSGDDFRPSRSSRRKVRFVSKPKIAVFSSAVTRRRRASSRSGPHAMIFASIGS